MVRPIGSGNSPDTKPVGLGLTSNSPVGDTTVRIAFVELSQVMWVHLPVGQPARLSQRRSCGCESLVCPAVGARESPTNPSPTPRTSAHLSGHRPPQSTVQPAPESRTVANPLTHARHAWRPGPRLPTPSVPCVPASLRSQAGGPTLTSASTLFSVICLRLHSPAGSRVRVQLLRADPREGCI